VLHWTEIASRRRSTAEKRGRLREISSNFSGDQDILRQLTGFHINSVFGFSIFQPERSGRSPHEVTPALITPTPTIKIGVPLITQITHEASSMLEAEKEALFQWNTKGTQVFVGFHERVICFGRIYPSHQMRSILEIVTRDFTSTHIFHILSFDLVLPF
jgi:hypothetical protein